MITLYPNEKILIVVHKHWIALFYKILVALVLFLGPMILVGILLNSGALNNDAILYIRFFLINYFLIITLLAFIFWTDYYLDLWIITNERIVDVEQFGLFRRETSEIAIQNVQDVTTETPGMLPTFLHYGNVRVQTAGEKTFIIKDVPNINEIKKIIMQELTQKNVGTQQMGAN